MLLPKLSSADTGNPLHLSLFTDDCIQVADLHRLRSFLQEELGVVGCNASSSSVPLASSSLKRPQLSAVLRDDFIQQDLHPFPDSLLAPLKALPPGKLPGIAAHQPVASQLTALFCHPPPSSHSRPSTPLATTLAGAKHAAAEASGTTASSPKRRKIESNVTIEHF